MTSAALDQNQKLHSGASFVSVRVRTFPLIDFIPMTRVLPPLLHLLLGLGNGMCSKFKEFANARIELKSNAEIEAQNMTFLTEIGCDEALIAWDDLKKEVQGLVQERIEVSSKLKQRGTARECKQNLRNEKEEILAKITLKTSDRDNAVKDMEGKKKTLTECRKA